MTNTKQTAIQDILDLWFTQSVVRAKELSFKYEIHNDYLLKQSFILQKLVKEPNRETFMSDYILECYLAMTKFTATDAEWLEMAQNQADSRLNELSKYVYTTVDLELRRDAMEQNGKIMSVDGEKALVKLPVQSIDAGDSNEDGSNNYGLLDILNQDAGLFSDLSDEEAYSANSFFKWFNDNRSNILTKNQDQFIHNMNTVHSTDSKEEVKAKLGIERDQINKKLDRIAERVVKAYNKQLPELETRQQLYMQTIIDLIQPVASIADREHDLDTINQDIFSYVKDNYEELQQYCNLTVREHQQVNKGEYRAELVYKLHNILTAKLKQEKARMNKISNINAIVPAINVSYNFVKSSKKQDVNPIEKGDMKVFYVVYKDGFLSEID